MKQWEPKDFVAIGLLSFVILYLIIVFVLALAGYPQTDNAGIREKEIIVFIVGVLSGYLGNEKLRND